MNEEEAKLKEDNEYIMKYQDAYIHAKNCGLEERFAKSYARTKANNPQAIRHIQTTKGTLEYFIDWSCTEGSVVMLNAKTVSFYYKTRYKTHPDADRYGVFFAFSDQQFEEGYNRLADRGFISKGDKIYKCKNGAYGTQNSLKAFFDSYARRDDEIKAECDPQEVYFFEYNNYECMYAWDGDKEAYYIIVELWGEETAKTITRI